MAFLYGTLTNLEYCSRKKKKKEKDKAAFQTLHHKLIGSLFLFKVIAQALGKLLMKYHFSLQLFLNSPLI